MSNLVGQTVIITDDVPTGKKCYMVMINRTSDTFNDYRRDLITPLREKIPNFKEPKEGDREFCCLVHFTENNEMEFQVLYLEWATQFGKPIIEVCRSRRRHVPNDKIRSVDE